MLKKIRDVFEIYIPCLAFIIMFLTFVAQVISRYVFNNPLTWAFEITVIGFSWIVILGACYAMRKRTHVVFTMIYDMLSVEKAAFTRLLGNIIIFTAFILLVIPSWKYINFMSFQSTSVFKIKLSYVFMPFVYFLFSIIVYTFQDIVEDIKIIRNYTKNKKQVRKDG